MRLRQTRAPMHTQNNAHTPLQHERMMFRASAVVLTAVAMIAFAGNSLLCRLALRETTIDAATFTLIRLASGAIALWALVRFRGGGYHGEGSWRSALALIIYAAAFSFAYESLSVGAGALLLFGAVQVAMISFGLFKGERFTVLQLAGFACACGGLVYLLWPGVTAPPMTGALLMIVAGLAWGVYSLWGRGAGDPTRVTAGNFVRSIPFAGALSLLLLSRSSADAPGVIYAVLSGAITSGVGYAIWYSAVRALTASGAAAVQLSVPVLAAAGGVLLMGEALTMRLAIASIATLGGIALVIRRRR